MILPDESIHRAVSILRAGGLVGLPTETVYGLAGDASNPLAVARIFAAKGRPADHPLIVHLAGPEFLSKWAREIPPLAESLAEAFWPGPLTLILKRQPWVLDLVTGGQDTIGLRVPAHPVAHAVLAAFGGGLAAPSANRFGRISPTTAAAVSEELGEAVDLVLEGGASEGGIESTIVDCTGEMPVILRPGLLTTVRIEAFLNQPVGTERKDAPRVSGSHHTHYAPLTPTRVFSREALLLALEQCGEKETPLAVMLHGAVLTRHYPGIKMVSMPLTAAAYAHVLYRTLRQLDHRRYRAIWIEAVPEGNDWEAIRDRLRRASA